MASLEETKSSLTAPTARRAAEDENRGHDGGRGVRSISVIIPTLNEATALPATLAALQDSEIDEIIVVDGGSDDETVVIARGAGARVEFASPGRGSQMNAGARFARGEILLFLHADTRPPERFDALIRTALRENPDAAAGAFALRIDAPGRAFRIIERAVAWRSKWRRAPYGDQAIFVPANTFVALGGFPDWPLLEDVEFLRRVRAAGEVVLVGEPVITSARRWRRRGVWRAMLLNQAILIAYRLGVSPQRLAKIRGLERG
ncbi:MAG: TIGR04283 family arsenosugar biosynthesis glycosyltransferase [Phycisphaerales bacterium]